MNIFKTFVLAWCIVLPALPPGTAASRAKAKPCAPILQQMDHLNQRMRHPYGSKEGEILRARLKKLSDELYECRKHRSKNEPGRR